MWLYHRCPPEMVGHTIVPLLELLRLSPTLYARAMEKYEERTWLRSKKIPSLNCYWGEVVFLSAFSPMILRRKLECAGFHPAPGMCYKIDPRALDRERATVLIWDEVRGEHYIPYCPEDVELYQHIPPAAEAYYVRVKSDGMDMPLLHQYVPQILYRGNINVEYALTVPF